jgi:hypothetical protein
MHHQNVGRAEGAIEPVGIAEASGKFAQPYTDARSRKAAKAG